MAFELNRAAEQLLPAVQTAAASDLEVGQRPRLLARSLLAFAFILYVTVVLLSILDLSPLAGRGTALALLALALVGAFACLRRLPLMGGAPPRVTGPAHRIEQLGYAVGGLGLLATALAFVVALLLPIGAYDALGYRLPAVAQWLDAGALVWVSGDDPLRNGYPLGLEVLEAVVFRAFGGPAAVDAVSTLFVLAGALALASFVRTLGATRGLAALGAGLFLLVPMHLLNAPSGYADAALAGCVVALLVATARWARHDDARFAARADVGIAAALVTALKPHGFAFAALALLAGLVLRARSAGIRRTLGEFASVAALAAAGAFFAVRNVLMTGNPLYPLEVRLGGRVLFAGPGSLDGILTPDFNVPRELAQLPSLLRPLWVWAQLHGPAHLYDDRLAGFGYVFLLVGLPATAWLVVRLWRRHGELPGVGLVLALTLAFWLLQPMSFWPRFTSWIWGAAAISIVLAVRELSARGRWGAALALVVACVALAVPEGGYALAHVKGLDRLGLSVLREDRVTQLARVSGVSRTFVEHALEGRSDVCRTAWRMGTDDSNLDGIVAQLSPRPRMHVIDDSRFGALAFALREHGCSELIVIGDNPLVTSAPPGWASRIRRAKAFGTCHLVSVSSPEVIP